MKAITRAYLFLSHKPVTVISMCATVVCALLIWKVEAMIDPAGSGTIGLQLAFTDEQARAVLSSWSEGGAGLFLQTIWINYLYAVSLSVLLASAPAYFARQRAGFHPDSVSPREALAILLPLAACLCDWAVLTLLIRMFSGGYPGSAFIMGLSATSVAKWVLTALCLAVLFRSYYAFRKEKRSLRS